MSDIHLILLNDSLDEVVLHKIKNILKICVMKSFTNAIKYIGHSGRIEMTPQDWIYSLKHNALSFCKNINYIEDFDNQYYNLLELYNVHNMNILDNNKMFQDTVDDINKNESDDDQDPTQIYNEKNNFIESKCTCNECYEINENNNIWNTWKSQNIIVETIKKNIDNIILQKFNKYI